MNQPHKLLFLLLISGLFLGACRSENHSKPSPDTTIQSSVEIQQKPKRQPLTDQAYTLLDSGYADSAFRVFNQVKAVYLKERDSFMVGGTLTNMAMIATEAGDSFDGQEYSLEALKFFKPDQKEHAPFILSNLNNLGIATYDLEKYEESLDFYTQSLPLITDSAALHISKNNIANAYRQMGQYKTAIKLYQEVLQRNPNERTKARTLTNLAQTLTLQGPEYNPVPAYLEALAIRESLQDLWGQNSSYTHLITSYIRAKRPDSALHYSKLMYNLALRLGNPDNELEAVGFLAELEPLDGVYFKRYQQLGDSLTSVRNAAKNQFALIRYETEKHKSENLRLAQENTQKELDIVRRTAALWLAIFGIIATILIFSLRFRRRKQRLAAEAAKSIRESKLKTSKEIHDVVANGLYRMMSEVEYGNQIDKEQLIDQIESLYHKSRQISHLVAAETAELSVRLNDLVYAFSNDKVKLVAVGLQDIANLDIRDEVGNEIILIVQELLVNMDKHSSASSVVLKFEVDHRNFRVLYRDNGVGMQNEGSKGSGLNNLQYRINKLHGHCTFANPENGGLEITITVPLRM